MAATNTKISAIAAMSVRELRIEWEKVFEGAAPSLPSSLLRRALAYQLQEHAQRGLPAAAGRVLDSLAQDPSTRLAETPIQLKPGTRLMREWNGRMHAVLVTDDGVLFEDQRYRSLSQVAHAITGARWSGPRFFGLRPKGPPPLQGVARG